MAGALIELDLSAQAEVERLFEGWQQLLQCHGLCWTTSASTCC